MIAKAELARKSKEWKIRFDVVEKDFCIGWLLKSIAEQESISNNLAFKGGTALRKCYFCDYRFSEDLDFTILKRFDKLNLDAVFSSVVDYASQESGCDFKLVSFNKIREVKNEEAYEVKISFRGPSNPMNMIPIIKVDITEYEQVMVDPKIKEIIHPYSDAFKTNICVYSLDEILAEKLRSVLQQKTRIPRPRDFYDIWYLLKFAFKEIDIDAVIDVFHKKCEFKNVKYKKVSDFFDEDLLRKNNQAWNASISKQVYALIEFDKLVDELKEELLIKIFN